MVTSLFQERIVTNREGKPELAILQFAVDQAELGNLPRYTVQARDHHVTAYERAVSPEGKFASGVAFVVLKTNRIGDRGRVQWKTRELSA